MKYIGVFYRFLYPYRWQMPLFLTVVAVAVVVESLRPYWLKMIIDSASSGRSDSVFTYFILFGVSIIVGNLISALSFFLGDRIMIPFAKNIRETIFRKVLDLDFAYHTEKNTGSLISAFKRGDGAVFDLYFNIHQELFRILIYLGVALYFLAMASLEMSLILLLIFSANSVLIWWLIKINLKSRTEFNKKEDEVSGIITDSLLNYETVKFFAAEKKEQSRLAEKFSQWTQKLWAFSNSFRLMDISVGTTSGLGMLWILWLAIADLNRGLTLGDFVMVTGFLTSFYYQFFNMFFRVRNIAKNMTDLERYFQILDNEVAVKDPVAEVVPKKPAGCIVFSQVGFSYPKDPEKTLSDISLTINAGEKVAFVGKSGAGKTTLIKLLLRFYDPTSGAIYFDGTDIRNFKKTTLRSLMGVVPQEPIMFNNTVRFNLSYGHENASLEEIRDAAAKANILEFIEQLPDRWDTEVGERGIKLSGGQKQRLAIARAILTDPRVLIFDEATSNLDSESEGKIQKALNEAAKKRTVIIVAHRFSTIRNVNRIFVLSDGTLIDEGDHASLLAKGGVYKMLWTLQTRGRMVA